MCKKRIDGVYLIKNNITKKVRIGSAKNIHKRFSNYKATLRKGNAPKLMQKDYNDFGEASFEFIILEVCKVTELFEREKYWQEQYEDCKMYNKNKIANIDKKIRRGLEAKKYKEKRSSVTSGENNGNNSKLKSEDVKEIRRMLLMERYTVAEIAEMFNCSKGLIYNIKTNYRWNSVQLSDKEIEDILKEKEAISFAGDTTSNSITCISLQTLQA